MTHNHPLESIENIQEECWLTAYDNLENGRFVSGIRMEAIRRGDDPLDSLLSLVACGAPYGYDSDGDHIFACPEGLFEPRFSGDIQATFPRGSNPRSVARVLRKFADMLTSPKAANWSEWDYSLETHTGRIASPTGRLRSTSDDLPDCCDENTTLTGRSLLGSTPA